MQIDTMSICLLYALCFHTIDVCKLFLCCSISIHALLASKRRLITLQLILENKEKSKFVQTD